MKRICAEFYRTERGAEPVREWLLSLGKDDRRLIGLDIRVCEYGWPIGMPTCRALGQGLFEIRTTLPQNRAARVLFFPFDGRLVLLHGFIKKTQQTPKPDLTLALARKKQVESKT